MPKNPYNKYLKGEYLRYLRILCNKVYYLMKYYIHKRLTLKSQDLHKWMISAHTKFEWVLPKSDRDSDNNSDTL